MDHPGDMGCAQCISDLYGNIEPFTELKMSLINSVAQSDTRDVFHCNERTAILSLTYFMNDTHIRMA